MPLQRCDLVYWGIRGSIAVGNSKIGGNTSCVELDLGNGHSVFFDAGTGIRAATANRKFKSVTICVSHFHWDHIQGFPFIAPLVQDGLEVEVLTGFPDIRERMAVLFDTRFHPVELLEYDRFLKFTVLKTGEMVERHGLKIQLAELNHPGKSFAFSVAGKIHKVVYATDSDYDPVPDNAKTLLRNADWAIMDSQFFVGDFFDKAHYGHASFKRAIDVCAELRIKNCELFHLDPNYSDDQLENLDRQARDYATSSFGDQGPRVEMAREGIRKQLQL